MARRASVIVPAHNEQDALPSTLRILLDGVAPGEFEIVVVANGCSDATAEVARRAALELGVTITVLEIPQASKAAAMNKGDTVVHTFPRIYLDADVACPAVTLRQIVTELEAGRSDLAVPTRRLDLSTASWWVRQYYSTWLSLPRVQQELSGRGAYGFSRSGRHQFTEFPAIIADDYWAVRQVPRARAAIVPAGITIRPPTRLRSLVAVRSRIYAANRAASPASIERTTSSLTDVRSLLCSPRRWVGGVVFLLTNAYSKRRGVRGGAVYGRDVERGLATASGPRDVSVPGRTL